MRVLHASVVWREVVGQEVACNTDSVLLCARRPVSRCPW